MKHLRRTLEVAVAVLAAAYGATLQSPVVSHFLDNHPQDAGYVALGAGVLIAAYKAARDKLTTANAVVAAPPSSSSSMGAK